MLNLKNIVHIRTIIAQFSRGCELHANANETLEFAHEFNNFFANLTATHVKRASCIDISVHVCLSALLAYHIECTMYSMSGQ